MDQQRALEIMASTGAVLVNSHFIYTSGKHGSAYVNKDAIYPDTIATSALCLAIAEKYFDKKIEVVIAPAIGGVSLEQWTAYHLTKLTGRKVLGLYAEKETVSIPDPEGKRKYCFVETGRLVLKRGYDKLVAGRRVLVIEDILNTGGSVKAVVDTVRAAGGEVVVACALVNRGGVTAKQVGDVPQLDALANVNMDAWDEEVCPLCQQDVPINTDVGHGRQYLAQKEAAAKAAAKSAS